MFKHAFFIMSGFLFLGVMLQAPLARSGLKNKTEEIYIWKLSDELKLSATEEQTFSDFIREMNRRRYGLNQAIQDNIAMMSKVKLKSEKEKLLLAHKNLLKNFNDINLDEVEKISKMLGAEKGTQYFVLKNEMNSKFKELLLSSDKKKEITTPPKIIIEQ